MTVHKLNDAPVVDQVESNAVKFLALLVWKLAPKGVTITMADIAKFSAEGGVLFSHGHPTSFDFRIVTPEEAARLAQHHKDTTSNQRH